MAEPNLSVITSRSPKRKTRTAPTNLCNFETVPKPDWVVKARDARGRTVWYARIEVTGFLPRRYGPFASRMKALLFLGAAKRHFQEPLGCLAPDDARRYMVEDVPFRFREGFPFVEDELGGQYRQAKD